jgi:hypothetical protein
MKIMLVKRKTYYVDKNIETVKHDFNVLTGNSTIDEVSRKLELFYGEIHDTDFSWYRERRPRQLHTPRINGKLIKETNILTRIEIEIIASLFFVVIDVLWVIIMALIILCTGISSKWNELSSFLKYVYFFIMIFLAPIANWKHYFYHLKNMLNDISLYIDGYYDKYIKRERKINLP